MSTCFVIMPITTPLGVVDSYGGDETHFEHVLAHLFTPAVEQAGYELIPPAVVSSEVIQAAIIRNLEKADLVLCDISGWNANVFFELGIRVALDRPVALVKDSRTDLIPFDNAPVSCHTYDSRLDPWVLGSEVPKLAQFIRAASEQQRNALWRYFGITQRAKESEPGDATQAKLDLLLAEVASLREIIAGSQTTTYSSPNQRERNTKIAKERFLVRRMRDILVKVGLAQVDNSITRGGAMSIPR